MTIRGYGSRRAVTTATRAARMAGTHAPITPTTITDTKAHTTIIGVNRISKASVVNVEAPNISLVFPTS